MGPKKKIEVGTVEGWGGEDKIESNEGVNEDVAEQFGEKIINVAEKVTEASEEAESPYKDEIRDTTEQLRSLYYEILSGGEVSADIETRFTDIINSKDKATLKEVVLSLCEDRKLGELGCLPSIDDDFGIELSLNDLLEHNKEVPCAIDESVIKKHSCDFMKEVMMSDGCFSDEQLDTLRLIKERGYSVLGLVTSDIQFDDIDDASARTGIVERRGRIFYDAISKNGLVDNGEIRSLYRNMTSNRMPDCSDGDYATASMVDAAISEGRLVEPDNEEMDYWQKLCQEKGAGAVLEFRQKIIHGKVSIFEDYDFNEPVIKDYFIRNLRNLEYRKTAHGDRGDEIKLISSEWASRLLEDDEYLEKMVMEAEKPGEYHGQAATVLQALLIRDRSVVDRIADSNIFEENPHLLKGEIFRKIHDGEFSEKERLGIFFNLEGNDWSGPEVRLDEKGECRDADSIELSDGDLAKICVLDRETRKRALRKYYRDGEGLSSLAWCDLDELNDAVGLKPQEIAYVNLLKKTDWPLKLPPDDVTKYFNENGPTSDFCDGCLQKLIESRDLEFGDLTSERREKIGLDDEGFIRSIRTMSESMPLYEFADVDKRVMHEALGEMDGLDDYLDFIKTFDGWYKRSVVGRRIKIEDIGLYYADGRVSDRAVGVLTDDYFSYLREDIRRGLGMDEEEFQRIAKDKFFDSSIDMGNLLSTMSRRDLESLFEDYVPISPFFEVYSLEGGVSPLVGKTLRQTLREMTAKEMGKCFDEKGAKPEVVHYIMSHGGTIDGLGHERLSEIMGANSSPKVDALLRGASLDSVFDDGEEQMNRSNALAAFARFIRMDADDWRCMKEDDEKVRNAFSEENAGNKNLVLEMFREDYLRYLKGGGKDDEFPVSLRCFSEYVRQKGGAGPLTQIGAFLDYCGELGEVADRELADGARMMERKMKKWSDQERASFYSISAEMMRADKDIFKIFLEDFGRIKEKSDFERFAKQVYPLYRAKLSLLKEYDRYGRGSRVVSGHYRGVDKERLIDDLRDALAPFTFDGRKKGETEAEYEIRSGRALQEVRGKILGEIVGLFGVKFRLKKEAIPEEFDDEMMRSIEDMTLYLSNLNNPTVAKQNYLGYMLAAQLNTVNGEPAWEVLRRGGEVPPEDYMMEDAARDVREALEKSKANDPMTPEILGFTGEDGAERSANFKRDLQREVSEIRLGNVLTVDVKLQNICANIEELIDPDLYDDEKDKIRIELLNKYSSKTIRSVANKLYGRLNGKEIELTEEEQLVESELRNILIRREGEVSKRGVVEYFQEGLNELSAVFGAYEKIKEYSVEETIQKMQRLLVPSVEVMGIFAELGEEFATGSGVQALSADIEYLGELIAKSDGRLSGSEEEREQKRAVLQQFYDEVRDEFVELTSSYERIVKNFESIKVANGNSASAGREKLAEKIKEIKDIIGGEVGGSQPTITTILSHHMPTLIENMRACLACRDSGCNNDTNPTFVDYGKFYLYSRGNIGIKGSCSDEIVFFAPIGDGEEKRMSLVMDRVYGSRSNDVFYNHVATVVKAGRELKRIYPEVRLSAYVTSASAGSCGVPLDENRLREMVDIPNEIKLVSRKEETVTIPESGFGDHYIEIGGGCRTSGERKVDGIEIIF